MSTEAKKKKDIKMNNFYGIQLLESSLLKMFYFGKTIKERYSGKKCKDI
jgi:hypothetical protein